MVENNWLEHLTELRRRLIYCLLCVASLAIPLLYYAREIYHIYALPLLHNLPPHGQMIAITVTAPLVVPLKLAVSIAVILTIPIFLYHLWMFIAPGLYRQERQLIWPLLICGSLLFYSGMLFAYWIIFPLLFHFFAASAPSGVAIMTEIDAYLSFTLKLFFAFGIIFEIPIIVSLLVRTGILSYEQLKSARRYVIVLAFVFGMLIAPDVISQTFLALPVWGLYEVGLLVARFIQPVIKLRVE